MADDLYRGNTRWHVMPDMQTLVSDVCVRICHAAQQAIARHGVFRIVLAGGATPQAIYRELAESGADWSRWQVYFGDERCLPADHPERNSVMAEHNWLDWVSMPDGNIHRIRAESGAVEAARDYARVVETARPFDMVLLGMGVDGHTASLFPGSCHDPAESVHAVLDAPKPPAHRVSLSVAALSDTRDMLFLVTGSNKHPAVERWRNGEELPVTHLQGAGGVDVYLDSTADRGF